MKNTKTRIPRNGVWRNQARVVAWIRPLGVATSLYILTLDVYSYTRKGAALMYVNVM